MFIQKVINNNVISAYDDKNREVVVMGRGIGFKAKPGDVIEESKIEKIFRIENETLSKQFQEILENIPLEYMQVTSEIITRAKNELGVKLNQSIYVTLMDHIHFAIQRQAEGIRLQNALLWEIKEFYKKEYQIGKYAIELLNDRLNIDFTEDEAGFIALHIVNAEYNNSVNNTFTMTNVLQNVLLMVKGEMQKEYKEESLHYERFLTHLKFLIQRIRSQELLGDEESEMSEILKEKYPREYRCSQRVAEYMQEQYGEKIPEEEIVYLTVHIRRVFA